jgi:hypothetical protein
MSNGSTKTNMSISESVKLFGVESWPSEGRIWVRMVPDGSAGLGWSNQPYTGTAAKAVQNEARQAAQRFAAMAVGDTCTVPVGYHPRHGIKTATWTRVR